MDSRKLERIILVILLLLNVFLLSVVLSDAVEARRNASETTASITALLRENGIEVADGAIRLREAPVPCVVTRDILREGEKVKKLIGDYAPEDVGGNIFFYRGDKGQALLRGSGELDVLMDSRTVPVRGGEERTAQRLLRRIGVAAIPVEGSKETEFYCSCEGLPVYNAVLQFTFTDSSLSMIGGTRLFDSLTKSAERSGMDSVSVLLRFIEIVRSEGFICSRIDSVEPGYLMSVTRSGEAELVPAWRIGTDAGALMIDAESGKAENRLT